MKRFYTAVFAAFIILLAVFLHLNTTKTNTVMQQLPTVDTEVADNGEIISPITIADFDNAVFIGDSRTQGLMMFGGITEAEFYTGTGITVRDVVKTPLVKQGNGEITITDALKQNNFDSIIIMLGINELGWAYKESFKTAYGEMLDAITAASPNSVIYAELIMPVNRELMEQPKDYITNQRIIEYNDIIKQVCEERNINCIDTFSAMCDKNGNLYEQASTDGIHLNVEFLQRWVKYLKGEPIYEIN